MSLNSTDSEVVAKLFFCKAACLKALLENRWLCPRPQNSNLVLPANTFLPSVPLNIPQSGGVGAAGRLKALLGT